MLESGGMHALQPRVDVRGASPWKYDHAMQAQLATNLFEYLQDPSPW